MSLCYVRPVPRAYAPATERIGHSPNLLINNEANDKYEAVPLRPHEPNLQKQAVSVLATLISHVKRKCESSVVCYEKKKKFF